MPKKVQNAKIACLDFSLQKAKMKMGVHVIVDDPEKLQGTVKNFLVYVHEMIKLAVIELFFILKQLISNSAIRQREADITKERVEKILASGANVILTTGGIDDLNTKYFVERGAMGVRRVLKKDMKRIAKSCGGTVFDDFQVKIN